MAERNLSKENVPTKISSNPDLGMIYEFIGGSLCSLQLTIPHLALHTVSTYSDNIGQQYQAVAFQIRPKKWRSFT